jgi:hypothetical protein
MVRLTDLLHIEGGPSRAGGAAEAAGGGPTLSQDVVVFVGLAIPVRTPLAGPPQRP